MPCRQTCLSEEGMLKPVYLLKCWKRAQESLFKNQSAHRACSYLLDVEEVSSLFLSPAHAEAEEGDSSLS